MTDCCRGDPGKCRCGDSSVDDGDGPIGDGGVVTDEDAHGTPPAWSEPGWDSWAEEILDDVEHDSELGKELARDALRVAEGELSKAEFHDRYADDVEDEFGIDERPTKHAGGPTDTSEATPRVPDIDGANQETRRNVLKALGAVAGGSAIAGIGGQASSALSDEGGGGGSGVAAAEPDDGPIPATGDVDEEQIGDPDREVQIGMVIDTDACIACLQCSLACKEENDTDAGHHWPYVFRYRDQMYGEESEGQLTRHCQHCSEASCTYVCPTQARYKREDDGIVLTDYDTCVGCKYCQVACPYGVNYLGKDQKTGISDGFEGDREDRDGRTVGGPPPKGVMGKCTFCVHRQDSDDPEVQGTTACEQRCPVDAIHFGDMNDPDSDPREYLRGEFDGREDVEDKHRFQLLPEVGNEPNIVYVGQEPSQNAEPIQGPTAYEDHDMQDGAYDYLEDGGEEE